MHVTIKALQVLRNFKLLYNQIFHFNPGSPEAVEAEEED